MVAGWGRERANRGRRRGRERENEKTVGAALGAGAIALEEDGYTYRPDNGCAPCAEKRAGLHAGLDNFRHPVIEGCMVPGLLINDSFQVSEDSS